MVFIQYNKSKRCMILKFLIFVIYPTYFAVFFSLLCKVGINLFLFLIMYMLEPWELGKKYDGNFIFTFAVSITTAKIFKHGNYLK